MKLHGYSFFINGVYYFIPWYHRTESTFYVACRVADKLQHVYPGISEDDIYDALTPCTCTALTHNDVMMFSLIGDYKIVEDLSLYDNFMILEV